MNSDIIEKDSRKLSTKALATQREILFFARELILTKGFSAMTIDDICTAAEISKGAFFYHFSSKEVLGEKVLDQFWHDVLQRQSEAEYKNNTDATEYLMGYIDHIIKVYQEPDIRKGCMLAIFTMELSESHPKLFKYSAAYFKQWGEQLNTMLTQTPSVERIDIQAWSELFISTLEGALLLAKADNDPQVIVRALSLYKTQLCRTLHYQLN